MNNNNIACILDLAQFPLGELAANLAANPGSQPGSRQVRACSQQVRDFFVLRTRSQHAAQVRLVEIGNELANELFAAVTCYLFNFCVHFNDFVGFIGNQGR